MRKLFTQFVLVFAAISLLFFVPQITLAQAAPTAQGVTGALSDPCAQLKAQIIASGGGRAADLPAYCNTTQIYNKITSWMYYLIAIGAVIFVIYGGYMYMTAASNDTRRTKAKNIIMYTLLGVVIAVLATLIISVVINLVVDNKFF